MPKWGILKPANDLAQLAALHCRFKTIIDPKNRNFSGL